MCNVTKMGGNLLNIYTAKLLTTEKNCHKIKHILPAEVPKAQSLLQVGIGKLYILFGGNEDECLCSKRN